MSKKVLSVMLAIMLVLSTFAVTAFAAGSAFEVEDKDEGVILSTQVWSLSKEATKVSDSVYKVDVALTTDYVTGAISFRVDAANGATLTAVEINKAVITYDFDLAFNANGLVAIVPQPATESEEGIEVDGVIATLTYTLAGEGDTLTLVNDAKTETNPGGDLIAVRLSDNNLSTGTMIYGQRVVDANGDDIEAKAVIASVNIGEAAVAPEIVVVDEYKDSVVIDTNKTFGGRYAGTIYGFEGSSFRAVKYLQTQLAAVNGTLTMTKSSVFTGAAAVYGTGATVTLNDASGNPVATYLVVIFGDLDGSGVINTADVNVLVAHNKGTSTIAAGPVHFAAQVHCTNAGTGRTININDVNKMVGFNKGTETIDQAALAAKHVTFTAALNYGSSYVMA